MSGVTRLYIKNLVIPKNFLKNPILGNVAYPDLGSGAFFYFGEKSVKKEMVLGRPFLSSRRCCSFFQMLRIDGSGMFITDPGSNFCPSRIPEPGSKDSGSWIRLWSKNISIITPKKFFKLL